MTTPADGTQAVPATTAEADAAKTPVVDALAATEATDPALVDGAEVQILDTDTIETLKGKLKDTIPEIKNLRIRLKAELAAKAEALAVAETAKGEATTHKTTAEAVTTKSSELEKETLKLKQDLAIVIQAQKAGIANVDAALSFVDRNLITTAADGTVDASKALTAMVEAAKQLVGAPQPIETGAIGNKEHQDTNAWDAEKLAKMSPQELAKNAVQLQKTPFVK